MNKMREKAKALRLRMDAGEAVTMDDLISACVTRDEALSIFELVEEDVEEQYIRIECCGSLAMIRDGIMGAMVECKSCGATAVEATSPLYSPFLERGNSYLTMPSPEFIDALGVRCWFVMHEGSR